MPPSPLAYEARYKTLKVEFIATTTPPVTLSIHMYRLGQMKAEGHALMTAARDYFAQQHKTIPHFELVLNVNGQPTKFKTWAELAGHVSPPFGGKGSPEDCQIVAQLAVLLNRPGVSDLQTYCDNNIGLDCNGFVGNFLWHVVGNRDWMTVASEDAKKHQLGPTTSIDGFFDKGHGRPIGSLDDIQPGELNVFGLVSGASFRIVPQKEGDYWGHTVISEPGWFSQASTGSHPSFYLNSLYVVESTGPTKAGVAVGLTDDWCKLTEYIDPGTKKPKNVANYPHNRIFRVHRNSKDQDDLFAIQAYSLPT